jgi:hypothetical protein
MRGLDPRIQSCGAANAALDGRVKPGHEVLGLLTFCEGNKQ